MFYVFKGGFIVLCKHQPIDARLLELAARCVSQDGNYTLQVMVESCQTTYKHGVYMEFTWSLHGVYMEFTWSLHGVYMEFTWSLHGVYMEFTVKHAWKCHGFWLHVFPGPPSHQQKLPTSVCSYTQTPSD